MSKLKTPDMAAFAGKDFDCVCGLRKGTDGEIRPYTPDFADWYACDTWQIPRLNKAQVLDDWSWIPDGFMWSVTYIKYTEQILTGSMEVRLIEGRVFDTKSLKRTSCLGVNRVVTISCIGLEEGYELEGMEVYFGK